MTEFWLVFFIKRCCLWRGPRKDNASCWIINPVVLNKSGLALLYFLNWWAMCNLPMIICYDTHKSKIVYISPTFSFSLQSCQKNVSCFFDSFFQRSEYADLVACKLTRMKTGQLVRLSVVFSKNVSGVRSKTWKVIRPGVGPSLFWKRTVNDSSDRFMQVWIWRQPHPQYTKLSNKG